MSATALLTARPKASADSTLADKIADRVQSKHGPVRTHLRIDVRGDVATLQGMATSFYQKQIWLHAAASVPGISRVVDSIEVLS
jgi:hypothetical protein